MADINTSTILPSVKFITTSATGELGEVNSAPATQGAITHDGLTFTLAQAGVQSPTPTLAIVEDSSATGLEFEVAGSNITLKAQTINSTPAVPATRDALTSDGITYRAENLGDTGLTVTINESQANDAMTISGNAITIDLDNLVGNKSQGDIANAFALAPQNVKDAIDITITDPAGVLTSALSAEALIGGDDEIPEVPATTIASYTQAQVQTAFDGFVGSDLSDLVTLSIESGSSNLASVLTQTVFNGADAIVADLDASSDYILFKRTDLHDLANSEQNDGRKVLWGLLHKSEAIINAQADKPTNFTIAKGNPVSVQSGTALRQTYTANATYSIDNLDLKSES